MFLPTVKESFLVRCTVEGGEIRRVSFVPALIGEDGRPAILDEKDEKCTGFLGVVRKYSEKLGTGIRISGNEGIIIGG